MSLNDLSMASASQLGAMSDLEASAEFYNMENTFRDITDNKNENFIYVF